jgi:hypothetical protein
VSIYDLARQLNPAVSSLTDGVKGIVSLPVGLAQQAASIPLGIAEQVATPIVNIPQQYPNLTRMVGGLARVGMGLGGDPLAATKLDYYNALGSGAQQDAMQDARLRQAYSMIQQQLPDFDPSDPVQHQVAMSIIGNVAGLEAMQDFHSEFDPNIREDRALEMAKYTAGLRDDVAKEYDDLQVVENNYRTIVTAGETYVAPVAMVKAFEKMLDPSGVVRESDYQMLASAGGMGDWVMAALKGLKQGGPLTEELRDSLIEEATKFYNNRLRSSAKRYDAFESYGQATGLYEGSEFDDLFGGYRPRAPIATGRPGDLDQFEYRPVPEEALDLIQQSGLPYDTQAVWDKKNNRWQFYFEDQSQPGGVNLEYFGK